MSPINWSDVPGEEVNPGIFRQTVQGTRSTVVRYVYQPGAVFPAHRHLEEQTTVVLTGRIVFEVDDRSVTVGPGQALLVPGGVVHAARVVGGEVVETINVHAPRREHGPGG
jgi:mannose-6-phosphate isomerase-like protein (cupin superfamily)